MLWESIKKLLPRKGRFVSTPFYDCDVTIKDMEISDDVVKFVLFNETEGEFAVSGNIDNIGIAPPDGELLRIECFHRWYINMYPAEKEKTEGILRRLLDKNG